MKTLCRSLVAMGLVLVTLPAQFQTLSDVVKGDKLFDEFDYDGALYYYEMVNAAMPQDMRVTRKIADSYRRKGVNNMAAEWYKKTLELDTSNFQDMVYYAEALRSLGEYDEAIAWYGQYAKRRPDDRRAQSHLKNKEYYVDLQSDSLKYVIKRLNINTSGPAIGLCRFENGKYLISSTPMDTLSDSNHSSGGKKSYFLDVYLCDLNEKGELINPVKLDKNVNSKYHDGPMYYSKAEKRLYITRNNMRSGRPERDKNGNVNLQLYTSKNDNGAWKSAEEVKVGDPDFSYGHPCLSKDGHFMYFASNMPGGFGGTDIYVSQRINDGWTAPINLGSGVNSEGNEMFPFLTDNGVLYFSSDGWAGLGGLDIFRSDFIFGKWMDAVNLGYPVNSTSDDFSVLYDNIDESGFFFSSRNGAGNDDVFSFQTVKLIQMIIAGTVRSSAPGHSLTGEKVLIRSLSTGITSTETLDENGQFRFTAAAGDKIEVTMVNPMLETDEPVFTFNTPQPVTDPYYDMGERTIVPERMDLLSAYLNSKTEKQELIARYKLTNVPDDAKPLTGALVDRATQKPLANTPVTATTPDGKIYTAVTDESGIFTMLVPVETGLINISAAPENFKPITTEVNTKTAAHEVSVVDMQLQYTDGHLKQLKAEGWEDVSGTVTDGASKKALGGAKVSAIGEDGSSYLTKTDEYGKFLLMVPAQSRPNISIEHKNYDVCQLTLPPSVNSSTLPDNLKVTLERTVVYSQELRREELLKNGVTIGGVLVDDSDGMPISGATVSGTDKDGYLYSAVTDDNGKWEIRVPQGIPMTLNVDKNDYSDLTIQVMTPKGKGKMTGPTTVSMSHTPEYKNMVASQQSGIANDKVELSGVVVDLKTGDIMPNANVNIRLSNGEEVTHVTDADGRFTVVVPRDDKVSFTVSKENYEPQTIEMSTSGASNKLMNDMKVKMPYTETYKAQHEIASQPEDIKKIPGFENMVDLEALDIQNVLFDYDKAFIRDDSKVILDQVAKIMKEQPSFNLIVRTHCDARGSIAYNQQLSMSRAMAVKGYLMQKGINKNRLKAEWFGEAKPLNHCIDENSNCSEQEFELNRRAEFKLVSETFSTTSNN